MITPAQRTYIETQAYVPEHLPAYVTAISQAEPYLVEDFVVYVDQNRLVFIGYPLRETFDETRMAEALNETMARFKPGVISVTAPAVPALPGDWEQSPPDSYYRLHLSALSISQKLRNMLNRASREVSVEMNTDFGEEHQKLVTEFLRTHPLDEATRFIFKRIPEYARSNTAWVFEARNKKSELVAFDVAELGARDYAFYMFNFLSRRHYVPGASDLLLFKVIEQAKAKDKRYINLGLGINPGVTFFKTKWGGTPFLPHISCLHQPARANRWQDIFDSLL
jgi:hypothetical protein